MLENPKSENRSRMREIKKGSLKEAIKEVEREYGRVRLVLAITEMITLMHKKNIWLKDQNHDKK